MFERENEVVVRTEVSGMSKEEIDISVLGNTLTISGERKAEEEVKKDDYYCCERSYGKFQRDITLPQGVDAEKINKMAETVGDVDFETRAIESFCNFLHRNYPTFGRQV